MCLSTDLCPIQAHHRCPKRRVITFDLGANVFLANVHLHHCKNDKGENDERLTLAYHQEVVDELILGKYTIIVGDFNNNLSQLNLPEGWSWSGQWDGFLYDSTRLVCQYNQPWCFDAYSTGISDHSFFVQAFCLRA